MGGGQNINITGTGVWKKLIPTLMDDFGGVQTTWYAREKSFVKGRVNRFGKLHCCPPLRNCHSHTNVQ
jgi:hypothetical protein